MLIHSQQEEVRLLRYFNHGNCSSLILYSRLSRNTIDAMTSSPPSKIYLLFVIMSVFTRTASAWTANWINLDLDIASSINPPRSGHVAFGLNDKVYVFGGYAEDVTAAGPERYPTNDLWCFENKDSNDDDDDDDDGNGNKWTLVKPASSSQPQARLAAAAVTCQLNQDTTAGLLLGGWDSQKAGTGGVILKDVQVYSSNSNEDSGSDSWKELPTDLQEPTSRLCAVTLGDAQQVLIHNHRCTDHVLLLDLETSNLSKQPVSGTAPSARGLHACVRLPGTSKIVLFGGAAQDGNMSNEVFVLDTETWVWENCSSLQETESNHDGNDVPSPRASPCFIAVDEKTCILFGGAALSDEGGLHGCSDTWLLEIIDSENNNDGSSVTTRAKWTQLGEDGSTKAPPGRNAATLTPLSSKSRVLEGEEDDDNSQLFLLSGGWYPFRTTYGDNFVLKVTKK